MKTSTITNVPELRFPEFEGKWQQESLNKIAKVNPRSRVLPNKFIYIDLESVTNGILVKEEAILAEDAPSRAQRVLDKGDILYQTVRPYQKNNYFFYKDGEYVASTGYAQIKAKYDPKFLFHFLHNQKFVNIVNRWSTGTSYPAISPSELVKIKVEYPKIQEQQKIAAFLSQVDRKIDLLQQKVSALETYKKGVMQQLFSQQLRFKQDDGSDFPDWRKRLFSDIFNEHKLKSTGKEIVHSVSVHKGIINQIEHLGRSFAAKNTDNYNRVKPNDIVYTKSPTGDFPLGIIKQSHLDKEVIVSPLYGVFTPETSDLGYILHVHFESHVNTSNYLSSIIQKGAKNTINITNKTFLSKTMFLPISKKEQNKIANYLRAIDKRISFTQQKLDQTQIFKKGLLQKLFV